VIQQKVTSAPATGNSTCSTHAACNETAVFTRVLVRSARRYTLRCATNRTICSQTKQQRHQYSYIYVTVSALQHQVCT
jgi:hypothetical protein